MKRLAAVLITILIPSLLIGLVYLNVEHFMLDREIRQLELKEERLIERNLRYISQASALSGPRRIRDLLEEDPGLQPADSSNTIYLELRNEGMNEGGPR